MSRALIVAAARSWIGTPYRHQASLKGVGCDCLGLLRGIWREAIGPEPERMPAYSPDWAEAGRSETLLAAAQSHLAPLPAEGWEAGDVLVFRWRQGLPAKHCGIAVSADAMVHAHEGASVAEVALTAWWRRHLCAAFRFPAGVP